MPFGPGFAVLSGRTAPDHNAIFDYGPAGTLIVVKNFDEFCLATHGTPQSTKTVYTAENCNYRCRVNKGL